MTSQDSPLTLPEPPRVGMVSLGCPKALVDSNAFSRACAPMAMP
jgi:hypothetical protein